MRSPLSFSIVLFTLACALAYAAWTHTGRNGLALSVVLLSPVFGIASVALLGFVFGGSARWARQIAYHDVEGRYFAYKGTAIDVLLDLNAQPWIRVDDVRRIIAGLPRNASLRRLFPEGLGYLESPRILRISASALDLYCQKVTDPGSLRFREWLRREIIRPSAHWRNKSAAARVLHHPRQEPAPRADAGDTG